MIVQLVSLILIYWMVIYPADSAPTFEQIALKTKRIALDSAVQRINLYPVDSAVGFPNTYPLDSDLSGR